MNSHKLSNNDLEKLSKILGTSYSFGVNNGLHFIQSGSICPCNTTISNGQLYWFMVFSKRLTMKYFTSDLHLTHMNISGTEGRWEKGHRGFPSLDEHNQHMIDMLNVAKPNDEIYILGDFVFNRKVPDQIADWLEQIVCDNLHIILGNHDPFFQRIYNEGDWWSTLAELGEPFHKIVDITPAKEVSVDRQHIYIHHYACLTWNKSHKGNWHLFGHSHNSLDGIGMSLDVCPESALEKLGEMRMWTFEDVRKYMETRQVELIDHHQENTNQ